MVELMVSAGLAATFSAMAMTSMLNMANAVGKALAYRDVHLNLRHALDIVTREVRASEGAVSQSNPSSVVIDVVSAAGTNRVTYLQSGSRLVRQSGGVSSELATLIQTARFDLYAPDGSAASSPTEANCVQITLMGSRVIRGKRLTDVVQTRVQFRNK